MRIVIFVIFYVLSLVTIADNIQVNEIKITKIRSVGDYSGNSYDGTVELWFTEALVWPTGSVCTDVRRVYIDSNYQHLVSAAYTAFIAGRKVNINVDTSLRNRAGACEVSFVDILNY